MKKISILALHLNHGGVENAICTLANMLCDDYLVEIASVYSYNKNCDYKLNDKVTVNYLTSLRSNKNEIKRSFKNKEIIKLFSECIYALKVLCMRKKTMKKYISNIDSDVIISSRFLFNKMLSKYHMPNVITIAQEHRHHNNNEKYIKKLCKSVKNIDYFLPVSRELTGFYKDKLKKYNTNVLYIEHAVDYIPSKIEYKNNKKIISIGRLSPEKGFIDLIEVFNEIYKKDQEFILDIFGDGADKNKIIDRIKQYKLENNIILHGFQDKEVIRKYLENSSYYIMTSHTESFGLVLIEAMAFGIPCFAFSSAQGACEIINQQNGLIIEDRSVNKMVNNILNLDKEKLLKMSDSAYITSKKYSIEQVQKKWLEFLKTLV